MKARPRAAFVVTVSLLGSVLGTACKKDSSFECKPPDCHANPPPLPPDTDRLPTKNPPAPPPEVDADGGAADATSSAPLAK